MFCCIGHEEVLLELQQTLAPRGGFRWGHAPPPPPKIRKAYVIQR